MKNSKIIKFDNNEISNNEGEDIMILEKDITSTIIIQKEKTKDFIHTINSNIPKKSFWDECKQSRNSFSMTDINTMNQLISDRLKNGR